jgi:hypothetical protein
MLSRSHRNARSRRSRSSLWLLFLLVPISCVTQAVHAATLTVTSTLDDGSSGTLRSQIAAASPDDSIIFDPAVFSQAQTITLNGTQLAIGNNLTISGPDVGVTISVKWNGLSTTGRVLLITSGRVTLSNCTLVNGQVIGNGGGISNNGNLTLNNCTLTGNRTQASRSLGGGIFNSGTLTLNNCTLSGNVASISSRDTSYNASSYGGAIGNSGTLTLNNCTIIGNHALRDSYGRAGGIYNTGTAYIRSSLIAFNTGSTSSPELFGTFISGGYNLIGTSDDSSGWQTTDLTGTVSNPLDPKLQMSSGDQPLLQNNGGPTPTHALLADSPALDQGKNFVVDTNNNPLLRDQRGVTRPYDIVSLPNAIGGDGSDIGAFELVDYGPDTIRPTVTINAPPSHGSFVSELPPTIGGTANDNLGIQNVSLVRWRLSGTIDGVVKYWNSSTGAWLTASNTLNATSPVRPSNNLTWSSTGNLPRDNTSTGGVDDLPSGRYTLTAYVNDKRGNSFNRSHTFTVDKAAPSITINVPLTNGATVTALPSTISGTVADDLGVTNVSLVRWRLRGTIDSIAKYWNSSTGAWVTASSTLNSTSPTRPSSNSSWASTGSLPQGTNLPNGRYLLTAYVNDKSGKFSNLSNTFSVSTPIAPALIELRSQEATSRVMVSGGTVHATAQNLVLNFSGALDTESAANSVCYLVTINGQSVEVESANYDTVSHRVTINLAESALSPGMRVIVKIAGLQDTQGRLLSDQKVELNVH